MINLEDTSNINHEHNEIDGTPRLNPKNFKGFPIYTAIPTHIALEGTIVVTDIDGIVSLYVMQDKTWHDIGLEGREDMFGDGSDGDVIISSNTTLTEDKAYDNLTINNGIVLNPAGYRIFVADTLTFLGTGKIASNGGDGGVGGAGATTSTTQTAGTAGAAGAVPYSGATLPTPCAGKIGVVGIADADTLTPGTPGIAGVDKDKAFLEDGKTGGAGGYGATGVGGAADGGAVGAGGSTNYGHKPIISLLDVMSFVDSVDDQIKIVYPSVGGGSGGSGGGFGQATNDRFASGGSGGSGSSGGMIEVFAKRIITVSGNTFVEAIGGAGGAGGAGSIYEVTDSNAGGSGGGAGGNGGIIILVYYSITSGGLTDVSGGNGGSGSVLLGDNSENGYNGQDGYDGKVFNFS